MTENRTESIRLYFTEGEKLVIKQLARRRGKKVNAFMRDELFAAFPQIVDSQLQRICINAEKAVDMLREHENWDEQRYQSALNGDGNDNVS